MATDNRVVGVVLPPTIYRFIEDDLKGGEYASVSDWVRVACREYYEKRKRERSGGGGAQYLIKLYCQQGQTLEDNLSLCWHFVNCVSPINTP